LLGLRAAVENTRVATEANPPEPRPVVLVVIDEDRDVGPPAGVLDPPQRARALRLRVDRRVERVAVEREHDRDEMRTAIVVDRGEASDPRASYTVAQYALGMHLGVILPNFGEGSTPSGILHIAEAAEGLEFDSVWATEHILVGPDAVNPYGRVYAPLITLAWVAGYTGRVGLGTSIVLAPLHHPVHLAKEAATLQELSHGRLKLGLGMGWHEDEFRFLGVEFRKRGRRGDEAIRLMRALWRGERSFSGDHWSFEDATFGPLPEPEPELWFGGSSERSIKRALEHGGVWHPSRRSDPDHVRRVKERYPEVRVIPRTQTQRVDAFLDAGAEGVVVTLRDEGAMREFVRRYR
jgi:probable F420-dependent oxidoreductase